MNMKDENIGTKTKRPTMFKRGRNLAKDPAFQLGIGVGILLYPSRKGIIFRLAKLPLLPVKSIWKKVFTKANWAYLKTWVSTKSWVEYLTTGNLSPEFLSLIKLVLDKTIPFLLGSIIPIGTQIIFELHSQIIKEQYQNFQRILAINFLKLVAAKRAERKARLMRMMSLAVIQRETELRNCYLALERVQPTFESFLPMVRNAKPMLEMFSLQVENDRVVVQVFQRNSSLAQKVIERMRVAGRLMVERYPILSYLLNKQLNDIRDKGF